MDTYYESTEGENYSYLGIFNHRLLYDELGPQVEVEIEIEVVEDPDVESINL